MTPVDLDRPFVIHLGVGTAQRRQVVEEARGRGMSVHRLDLTGVGDREVLVEYLAEQLRLPHRIVGLDAAIDSMSDLEWMTNSAGHVVVADVGGLSDAAVSFCSMLPNVIDRWRSGGVPFTVLVSSADTQVLAALNAANAGMARAGALPWAQSGTGPVDVVQHSPRDEL